MAVIVPDVTALINVTGRNHRGVDVSALASGNATIVHGGKWLRQIPAATLVANRDLTLDHTGMRTNFLWAIQRLDQTIYTVTLKNLAGDTIGFFDSGLKATILFRLDERGLEEIGTFPIST